jgi:hypothetical protein
VASVGTKMILTIYLCGISTLWYVKGRWCSWIHRAFMCFISFS